MAMAKVTRFKIELEQEDDGRWSNKQGRSDFCQARGNSAPVPWAQLKGHHSELANTAAPLR